MIAIVDLFRVVVFVLVFAALAAWVWYLLKHPQR
jgi:hypothetical protein